MGMANPQVCVGATGNQQVYSCILQVKIGVHLFPSLLDTGSAVSLIERHICNGEFIVKDKIYMRTAGIGSGLMSEMSVKRKFFVGDRLIEHEFLVVDNLNLPGISIVIGFDLISQVGLEIIPGNGTHVYFGSNKIPILMNTNSLNVNVIKLEEKCPLLHLTEDVCIPAQTVLTVQTNISDECVNPDELFLINAVETCRDFCLTEAVVKLEGKSVSIPIYNFSPVPLKMLQGTQIAYLEKVTLPDFYNVAPVSVEPANNDEVIQRLLEENTPPLYVNGIRDIVMHYREQFVILNEKTGSTSYLPFEIDTQGARPIAQRPYRLPIAYETEVNRQLSQMLEEGIISRSKSPWASPMVVVKKKDQGLRICIDYRKLNSVTVGDSFPLPSIEELLLKVRNAKFFSTLDLKQGYHQITVNPSDRCKTAFTGGDVLYEYNRLPFGLKNGPSHFSRLVNAILAPIINSAVLVYLDDIIIVGDTIEEHTANLIKVLEILKKYNLKCSLKKCKFFQQSVEFLGHIVTPEGLRPVHDKISAIRNFPVPRNARDVSSFLGLSGYYRKFVHNYAFISRPLDRLRKSEKFVWTTECQEAFDKLRKKLSSDDILMFPRFDRPFLVTCDASSVAIGGVVSQLDDRGDERPISFCSRALKGAELNYSTTDREALAIKFVLERHRYFLLGYKVKIKSDHQPLRYLFLKSDLSSRHARWLDSVLEFDICDFEYIIGKSNKVADALSRNVPTIAVLTRAQARAQAHQLSTDTVMQLNIDQTNGNVQTQRSESNVDVNCSRVLNTDCTASQMNVCVRDGIPINEVKVEWDVLQLVQSQDRDPIWSKVKQCIRDNSCEMPDEVHIPRERFLIEDEVLYVLTKDSNKSTTCVRTVLTSEFAKLALELVHSCPIMGHLGYAKTLKRAKSNFYWLNMNKEIKDYVENCILCLKFKGHRIVVPPARQWPIAQEKFFRVHMDLIGPLPLSPCGNRYICVITDALTRFTATDAIPNKSALTVAKSFVKFINMFGCPRQLISDQGREFNNELLAEVNKIYGITHNHVAAYRPSANGLVESKNKQIMSILRMLVADSPLDWPNKLQIATTALNTAYNRCIGDNPHFLVYAQDIRYPFDTFLNESKKPYYNVESYRDYLMETTHRVFKLVKYMLSEATETNKHTYNIRFSTRESKLKVGDRVYVKRQQPSSKLDSKFVGPFRILEVYADKVRIKNLYNNRISCIHLSHVLVIPEGDVSNITHGEIIPSIYPDAPCHVESDE